METEEKTRKHKFTHRKYLEDVAERILLTRPNKEILFNTLLGVYETALSTGYGLRIEDSSYFKNKRKERQRTSWNSFKDYIDDLIHDKGKSKIINPDNTNQQDN